MTPISEYLTKPFPQFLQRQNTADRVHARKERDVELEGLASLDYDERIAKFIRDSTRHWVKGDVTVIDFRPLYAVNIHHLQRQIVRELHTCSRSKVSDEQLENIGKLLKQYSNSPCFIHLQSHEWRLLLVKDTPKANRVF